MYVKHLALILAVLALTACGGGGDSGTDDVTSINDDDGPIDVQTVTFEPGVFLDSTNFQARCETPRSGNDAVTGEPFDDVQGSAFLEKMWLRSWTYESYLWFDEVIDNDPEDFTVAEYFAQLRTNELTESGRPRDNFHFSQNTAEFNQLSQTGVTRGYGLNFQRNSSGVPREFIVRFTEPGSAARLANIPRGAVLITVDGVDFVSSTSSEEIDAINAGLFPSQSGSQHSLGFRLNDGTEQVFELVSEDVTVFPVQNASVLNTAIGPVGYMLFNSFNVTSQAALIDAFEMFDSQGVNELVIDLRYNGGGRLALASQLGFMVAGDQSEDETFTELQYNGKFMENEVTRFFEREIDYDLNQFIDRRLPSANLSRVFILSTENTCSASESLINGLRGIGVEVVMIGDTTCGKPFGFFPTDNCGVTYFTIQFQSVNAQGFGEYQDGFVPTQNPLFGEQILGCEVDDDFSQPLGSENEALFATALGFMQSGTAACPPQLSNSVLATQATPRIRQQTRSDIIVEAIANDNWQAVSEPQ